MDQKIKEVIFGYYFNGYKVKILFYTNSFFDKDSFTLYLNKPNTFIILNKAFHLYGKDNIIVTEIKSTSNKERVSGMTVPTSGNSFDELMSMMGSGKTGQPTQQLPPGRYRFIDEPAAQAPQTPQQPAPMAAQQLEQGFQEGGYRPGIPELPRMIGEITQGGTIAGKY